MNKNGTIAAIRNLAWAEGILDLFLPRHCVACGMASGESNLCLPCTAELPRNQHACRQCGLRLSIHTDSICGNCLKNPPPWRFGIAGLDYQFPVDHLVCRFKFSRDLACGHVLGMQLIAAIKRGNHPSPEVIVPVPLHRSRHFSRSFNQAELLARQISKALQIPVLPNLLRRIRRTRAQTGLDARERRKNTRGAFSSRQTGFSHVALVDDVMTTGATLAECTRTLQRSGVACVSAWVAARADINRSR